MSDVKRHGDQDELLEEIRISSDVSSTKAEQSDHEKPFSVAA